MHRGTPSQRYVHHSDRLNGATANSYSPAYRRDYRNHNRRRSYDMREPTPASPAAGSNLEGGDERSRERLLVQRNTANSYYYSTEAVDPQPVSSLVTRLQNEVDLKQLPEMKMCNNLPSHLDKAFGGKQDDWYQHMEQLELDVF